MSEPSTQQTPVTIRGSATITAMATPKPTPKPGAKPSARGGKKTTEKPAPPVTSPNHDEEW